jgi:hypothetical protein
MTWRSFIAAGSMGTSSSRRSWVSTKPPGCCERWRGAGQFQGEAQAPIAEIEVQLLDVLWFYAFVRPAPHLRGQHFDQILGQTERLADIAKRALGSVAGHDRAERGMIAAIGFEHPLHDGFAPLMLEVHVDIRGLAPLLRDETLKQQIVALGVDGGDSEHIANRAVGGGAAALTENVPAAGEAND